MSVGLKQLRRSAVPRMASEKWVHRAARLLLGDAMTCMVCGEDLFGHEYCLCERCFLAMPFTTGPTCNFCGRGIESPGLTTVCGDCFQLEKMHYGGRCCTRYEDIASKLIFDYKYNDKRYIGRHMGALMAAYCRASGLFYEGAEKIDLASGLKESDACDRYVIVPVPTTKKRLRVRGFHHTLYLAEVLSHNLNIPLMSEGLVRVHHTKRLKTLDRDQRLEAMKDAFETSVGDQFKGKIILLVDDILTTGATLSACTKVLMPHEPAQVVWVTFSGVV